MISILVNDKPLHITKGTSLQLEVNSSIFSTEKIEGDIIFTFDIPAEENDCIFRHARFIYVQRTRKYSCSVLVGGVEIAHGDLYIQKATRNKYSCGLVVNPFPTDFADRKLSENDYGEDIAISHSARTHFSDWLSFLKSTLADNSVVKFPLFVDTALYGSSNNDFGWFLLPSDSSSSNGLQASLQTNNSIGLDRCYVNRLFFDENGNVIEEKAASRGIRVFNNRLADNPNSFAFCPAIRLSWLIQKVALNGGYNAGGNFFKDEAACSVFSQSMRALDGLMTQFTDGEAGMFVEVSPEVSFGNETAQTRLFTYFINEDGNTFGTLAPSVSGNYHFHVVVRTYLPANVLTTGYMTVQMWGNTYNQPYKDALFFMLMKTSSSPHVALSVNYNANWSNMTFYGAYGVYSAYQNVIMPNELYGRFGYVGAGFYEITYDFNANLQQGQTYRFIFGKCRGHIAAGQGEGGQIEIQDFENVPITEDVTAFYKAYNCFANILKYGQHVPSLTNADFISTVCNAFGLALFVDSATKQAEFSFIADILSKSGFLDLTPYAVDDETSLEKIDDRKYVYKLEGISTDEHDETKLLPPVQTCDQLPSAMSSYGKSCFVTNENQYRTSEREGNSISNWQYKWNTSGGADQSLEVGIGSEQSVRPSLKIPNMKITDENSSTPEFVMQIEAKGCSPIFDTENGDFDMILETYFGSRRLECPQMGSPFFEVAQPTCHLRNGVLQNGVSLTVSGEKSIGEMWVKPWLDFLATYEKVKYRFVLPLPIFLQLWQLLKPQDLNPERQTRWIMVNHVCSLPIKITFQFSEGNEMIIAEVEAAKRKVEL